MEPYFSADKFFAKELEARTASTKRTDKKE
jgi:hypothetical protein